MINEAEFAKYPSKDPTFRPLTVELEGQRFSVVAFADLDGTINDETYPESERLGTITPAKNARATLETKGIPVGIITGRSFGEAVLYQQALNSHGPIICEDGAVVVLPEGYSQRQVLGIIPKDYQLVAHEGRISIVLSAITVNEIREFLDRAQKGVMRSGLSSGTPIISTLFDSPETIQKLMGHKTNKEAKLSMDRLASAYIVQASEDELNHIKRNAGVWGIRTFGTPLHLIGIDADKGSALQFISKYARLFFPSQDKNIDGIVPITFGNNTNDLRLAEEAQKMGGISVLVGRPGGGYFVPETDIPTTVIKTKEPHGEGMEQAIPEIFSRLRKTYNIEI